MGDWIIGARLLEQCKITFKLFKESGKRYSPIIMYKLAKVIRTAPEPVLKTVCTVMNRMGIDTSLWRLESPFHGKKLNTEI